MEYFSESKTIVNLIIDDWKLLLILTLILVLYFYYTNTFNHFEKKGIKYQKPTIFLGNLGERISGKKSFHAIQYELYNYFKGVPCGGTFDGSRPILNLIDADLIKAVTIRDFDYFVDRNNPNFNEPRYVNRSLVSLKGAEWKAVRSILTPVFSSARLKSYLPLVEMCSEQMVDFLKPSDGKDIEMKEIMGHFTLEVIGACAFGIKCDALKDENAHFIKVAKKFLYIPTSKRLFSYFLLMFMPNMMKFFKILVFNLESVEELVRILKAAKAERKSLGIRKNDFLQLLIDAAENETADDTKSEKHLDDDTIDAQSLLFLLAGYETTSTLLSFAIYVLATKPELQNKLRDHIVNFTEGKEMSYELLSNMPYLEGFLLETLRRYPAMARLDRICVKNYTLPGTSVHLQKGDMVGIPIYGIHMDPEIYPDPEEFRPERFMDEEKKERPSHLFLPFGVGPRKCIGIRFAMISAKLAMVALLTNFKFSVCDKTQIPVEFNRRTTFLQADKGLWVRLDALKQ